MDGEAYTTFLDGHTTGGGKMGFKVMSMKIVVMMKMMLVMMTMMKKSFLVAMYARRGFTESFVHVVVWPCLDTFWV